jgi:hypothetical protein
VRFIEMLAGPDIAMLLTQQFRQLRAGFQRDRRPLVLHFFHHGKQHVRDFNLRGFPVAVDALLCARFRHAVLQ